MRDVGRMVSDVWEHMMRTSEDPMRGFFHDQRTYREKLDAPKINYFGEVIPRIEIVRQNPRQLKRGNTQEWRGFDVKDRRQLVDRRRK